MTLVNLTNMLQRALVEHYAIGCFNAVDLQSARAIVAAAETEQSPIIIAIAEVHLKYVSLDVLLPICIQLTERSSVPIAIILDHGKTFTTIMKAIQMGVSSVMFDGSIYEFEENIQKTQELVKIAHSIGISVEAELGHVARPEDNPDKEETDLNDPIYTRPQDVNEFVNRTGVDALAISFGTMHGICKQSPKLNLDIVREIKSISKVPLVMHGASGLSDGDIRAAIAAGITKINYYSDIAYSTAKCIQDKLNQNENPSYYHDIITWGLSHMIEQICSKIRLFGSNNRINIKEK